MNTWKPGSYLAKEIEENIDNKKFVVPLYQRGLVWKESQEAKFIDTIKRGLPFGTILLYHDEKRQTIALLMDYNVAQRFSSL